MSRAALIMIEVVLREKSAPISDVDLEAETCRRLRGHHGLSRPVGDPGYHDAFTTLVASGAAKRVAPGMYAWGGDNPQPQEVPWD